MDGPGPPFTKGREPPTLSAMRMSRQFSRTLRETPSAAKRPPDAAIGSSAAAAGHRLLLRGGFLCPLAAGSPGNVGTAPGNVGTAPGNVGTAYALLPLGARVLQKLDRRLEEGLAALGAQPLILPDLPAPFEETVADLAGREVQSYRQLPQLLSHRLAFRRESALLAADEAQLRERAGAAVEVCRGLLRACALEVLAADADPGPLGASAERLFTPLDGGPERFLACPACGYRAESRIAAFRRPEEPAEALLPVQRVPTPDAATIEALCRSLGVPASRTSKSVFLMAAPAGAVKRSAFDGAAGGVPAGGGQEQFVLAVVRGDRDLSEPKLLRALIGEPTGGEGAGGRAAISLRQAGEEEIRRQGIEPGYGSAAGLPPPGARRALVVVDSGIPGAANLVAGGNERGFHLLHVNCGRDYRPDRVADIAAARDGDGCPACGAALREVRGVGLALSRLWGEALSRFHESHYQDPQGRYRPIRLGTLSFDLSALIACLAEAHHDGNGPIWPPAAAPFPLVLVDLCRSPEAADRLYAELLARGCTPLYDDRAESAGVKFADADLSGIPLRLTVGERSLQQGVVELKRRDSPERVPVPLGEAVERVLRETAGGDRPPG